MPPDPPSCSMLTYALQSTNLTTPNLMAMALTCRYDTDVALGYRQAGETMVIKGYEKLWKTDGKLAQLLLQPH